MRNRISLSIIVVLFVACLFFPSCKTINDPMDGFEWITITVHYQQDPPDGSNVCTGAYFQDPSPGDEHKPWGIYVEATRSEGGTWGVSAGMESEGTPGAFKSTIHSIWVNGTSGSEHIVAVTDARTTGTITIEVPAGYSVTQGSGMEMSIRIRKAG